MTFDRLAPFYRWMERVAAGRLMEQCRTAHLDQVPEPKHILILGEGHGRSLAACRRRFPNAFITCVEASAGMIAQARQHLVRLKLSEQGIGFIHSDVFEWQPDDAVYDLVVTHFFLDCFDAGALERLVPRIATAAAPKASWLLADFQIAPSGWRRWRSKAIVSLLYAFFRHATGLPANRLVLPDPLLACAGFQLRDRKEFSAQLLKSEWWQRG